MTPLNVNLRDLIKQLDKDLTGADPLAKVTEAQQRAATLAGVGDQLIDHFVSQARAGGTSWSQLGDALGVSKQAAQQRWVPPIFQRFTDRARQVVVLAQERSRELRHGYIDTEHLLLGVLGEAEGLGARVVVEIAGSREAAERAVIAALTPGTTRSRGHIPMTGPGKSVLEQASGAAAELGHKFVGTEHILLGLLRVPDGKAAELLAELGVGEEQARARIAELVDEFMKAHPEQADRLRKSTGEN
jgi:hypothetical protein